MALPAIVGRPVLYRLYQLAWAGLDWLFPPHCGGCGESGSRWCSLCESAVRHISDYSICQICSQILPSPGLCVKCQARRPSYLGLRGWAVFDGPLREGIHRLKYKKDIALGECFSQYLISLYSGLTWQVDLITAVPMDKNKLAKRGYNQAAFLAIPFAIDCKIPYNQHALGKTRNTSSQVGLTIEQRRMNVDGAFKAQKTIVEDKAVLVIDDVATTGATMEACAKALLEAGAAKVYGLVLARASHAVIENSR